MKDLKKIIKLLTRPVLEWMVSEKLKRAYLNFRSPKTQKFWQGGAEEIPSPQHENIFFHENNIIGRVVSRQDDYRASALIKNDISFVFEATKKSRFIQYR